MSEQNQIEWIRKPVGDVIIGTNMLCSVYFWDTCYGVCPAVSYCMIKCSGLCGVYALPE